VYSAPYIWVNPETGQIETVNPGPRLKAHEAMASSETAESAATETMASEGAGAQMAEGESAGHAEAHTPIMHPLIVLIGMAAIVAVMVGMARKTAKLQDS
ncbi:MAG: hypothetical protein HKN08_10545, partial [Gammaproteobacteria bacterium]|nr:hypothetical protein [Gammaproteobacteria bacterium]